jgi:hypothetical protein
MHKARRIDAGKEARANAWLEAIARQKARELLSVVELGQWNIRFPLLEQALSLRALD